MVGIKILPSDQGLLRTNWQIPPWTQLNVYHSGHHPSPPPERLSQGLTWLIYILTWVKVTPRSIFPTLKCASWKVSNVQEKTPTSYFGQAHLNIVTGCGKAKTERVGMCKKGGLEEALWGDKEAGSKAPCLVSRVGPSPSDLSPKEESHRSQGESRSSCVCRAALKRIKAQTRMQNPLSLVLSGETRP